MQTTIAQAQVVLVDSCVQLRLSRLKLSGEISIHPIGLIVAFTQFSNHFPAGSERSLQMAAAGGQM